MDKENIINNTIAEQSHEGQLNTNQISDGYHTFGELYEHRITLWIALCRNMYNYRPYEQTPVWMSRRHSDGTEWPGWFLLGIYTEPGKQITYHLPSDKMEACNEFARELVRAPEWDGHTSEDVLERIKNL